MAVEEKGTIGNIQNAKEQGFSSIQKPKKLVNVEGAIKGTVPLQSHPVPPSERVGEHKSY